MHLVRLTGQHLIAHGMEAETFLQHVGVSEQELTQPDSRLAAPGFRRARGLVEDLCSMDHFDRRPAAGWLAWVANGWPDLASLWLSSCSLGAAMQAYARYRPLIGDHDHLSCQVAENQVVLQYTPDPGAKVCLLSAISNFLVVRDIANHYRDRVDWPVSMRFELGNVGRCVSVARVTDLLQAGTRVESTVRNHRVVLQGRGVWAPADGHQETAYNWSVQSLDRRLQSLTSASAEDPLVARIAHLIEHRWTCMSGEDDTLGLPALLQDTADAIAMSRWTLRRHLAARGLTFADLVEQLRARRLRTLMSDPGLSLLEVGSRLGFASQSAFSRYYRSQHGYPPSRDPAWRDRAVAAKQRYAPPWDAAARASG